MSKNIFSYFKKTPSKPASQKSSITSKPISSQKCNTAIKLDKSSPVQKSSYLSGEVIWAKLDDFPWWPGMVCNDPKKNLIRKIENEEAMVHVQFFGTPPTHDWVKESKVESFDQHQATSDEDLQVAYKQAEKALTLAPKERLEEYYACVNSSDEEMEHESSGDKENKNFNENGDEIIKPSKKRLNVSTDDNKRRKRVKLIESDSEEDVDDDEMNDSTYEPKQDDKDENDDYESDSEEESESLEESTEDEKPSKRQKKLQKTPSRKAPQVSFLSTPKTPLTPSTPLTPKTPLSNNKFNTSITKAQSKLSQFSSPTVQSESGELKLQDELSYTHMSLEFLKDGVRKDKHGKLHTHPLYDPRTLYVPDIYINSKEVTPGFKQWWKLKKDLYDTVIFFKVGKFYELYHMDACIGVKELGLTYMKGKFAHCGFPEIAFSRYSEVLVQRGYKVARIEQTETPAQLAQRAGGKVVRREVCAIISKGTRTFSFMEGTTDETTSAYLLAIVEKPCNDICLGGSLFGFCFVDTSIGKFYLGQFKDDRQCSRFLTMIAQYPPVQVLYERNSISPKLNHILNHELITTIKEALIPNSEFWDASKTLKHLYEKNYFNDENSTEAFAWPAVIKSMLSDGDTLGLAASDTYQYAVSALGACTWYLKKCCIDEELLSMSQFEEYIPTDSVAKRVNKNNTMSQYMILDGVTLTNLDIVINNDGNTKGTLLELLDHCTTPFGKRYFKQWLCSPLCNKKAIENRLNSVEDLMNCPSVMNEVRNIMRCLPDMERILRRIHSLGSQKRSNDHPDGRAIMYNEETYSKKKIADLLSAIDGFNKIHNVMKLFQENMDSFSSPSFKRLLLKDTTNDAGIFPDLLPSLKFFQNAFNHKVAKETGLIHPKPGVVSEYDRALDDIQKVKTKLDEYLKQQRKRLGCSSIVYWGTGKNRFQMEIPESTLRSNTPNDYHLKSQKKGYKRYQSNVIENLFEDLVAAEERRDAALKDTMREIFNKFDKEYNMWEKAVKCLATLDCLMSLAFYSLNIDGTSCRPEIVDIHKENGDEVQPFFELLNCRHPCITLSSGEDFIPNDIILGKSEQQESDNSINEVSPSCLLITGPNMGGKSTLMRQAGVILIMAQLGCYVPAEACRFTPVDRVFTRLGARDRILHGESTFFVELSETSIIFQHATKHSLVLLDELGRGTATYDGTAIATAVVTEIANNIGCRTLFSTHYHTLVEDFSNHKNIKLGHMACMVEKDDDVTEENDPCKETITFLYKFSHGACPKSYGFNAAKLAGLPLKVVKTAYKKAQEFEQSTKNIRKLRSILSTSLDNIKKDLTLLVAS